MSDVSNLHRPVSNRGQWRDSFAIVATSAPDPSVTVFGVQAWPSDQRCGRDDYGFRSPGSAVAALSAVTNDGTGRLSAAVVANAVVLSWLFSTVEMQRLRAGSYEMGILAQIGGEMAEIQRVRFVVQDRGGAPAPSMASSSPPPAGGGNDPGYAIDVKEF